MSTRPEGFLDLDKILLWASVILDRLEFVESIFMLAGIKTVFQILHELVVRNKVIKLFSINLEFKPELLFSGNLSLIKSMTWSDMVALFLSPFSSIGSKSSLPKRSSKLMEDMRGGSSDGCQILCLILPFGGSSLRLGEVLLEPLIAHLVIICCVSSVSIFWVR